MGRIILLFLKRLWLPTLVFGAFCLLCVGVYMRMEGLRPLDAFFGFSIPIPSTTARSGPLLSCFQFLSMWEYSPFRCGSRSG